MSNDTQATCLITSGNAVIEGRQNDHPGWFIGWFMNQNTGLRFSREVEVKWGEHPSGEARVDPSMNEKATTLSLLIHGHFMVNFPDSEKTVYLRDPGDYVVFRPGVNHSWRAIENSTVVTVRWYHI